MEGVTMLWVQSWCQDDLDDMKLKEDAFSKMLPISSLSFLLLTFYNLEKEKHAAALRILLILMK